MSTCSDEFPKTDVFYDELSDDTPMIACLAMGVFFTILCILIFIDEIIFIRKKYVADTDRLHKTMLLLGLYPVVCMTSLLSLVVPTSTIVMQAVSGGYIAICIYTFVSLIISYFGNEDRMVERLANDKIRLNLPPLGCCLGCILRPITLTRKSLRRLELCCLQTVLVNPLLLLTATALWTDGKYKEKLDFKTSYPYVTIPIAISTLLSIYGMIVIFRASVTHLKPHHLAVKFASLQVMIILNNLQRVLFNGLAERDVPSCVGTRDSNVRGTAINNAVLVVECFLLSLLARHGYRRPEDVEPEDSNPKLRAWDNQETAQRNFTLGSTGPV